jgi:hypothetical protein
MVFLSMAAVMGRPGRHRFSMWKGCHAQGCDKKDALQNQDYDPVFYENRDWKIFRLHAFFK